MAGRKLKISNGVAASTILEVIIAMVVIVLIFGIAMMIYSNVTRSSLSVKKIKAEALLQERLKAIGKDPEASDGVVAEGDFQVELKIMRYNDDSLLNVIQLTAWDGNHQKVAELQKVILKP